MSSSERERIDAVAQWFSSFDGFNGQIVWYTARHLVGLCRGASVLELGCADGSITAYLADRFARIVAVDGSADMVARATQVVAGRPNVQVLCSLFEDLAIEARFDTVWVTHVLEHVADPVATLRTARAHLAPGGVVIACVANAQSIHRLVGVHMGLLPSPSALSEMDVKLGHRRVYTAELLRQHAVDAGLKPVEEGGFLLKPLSNAQMESWPADLLAALFDVGKGIPAHAAEIYIACEAV